ncbi:MAG: phosphoglucomutase/phosphomannomutase family protein [Chloroflexi bacterium]|nr:MAG: phosphoglucomutase/phosphomannomutase family protein [Chloroflexota bacterium]
MARIKFGTDGWRGTIAEDFTFDNVRRCAQGFARYLIDKGEAEKGVVVGHDRRFASEHFAAAVAEVMAAHNIHVYLTQGATPTPVISYSIVAKGAGGGVNITASHNPPLDNGFKVRDRHGAAVDPQGLREIEARIPSADEVKRIPLEEALEKGLVEYFDPAPEYIEHISKLIDVEPIKEAGLLIVHDAMYGNGARWLENILGGEATRVVSIRTERNPLFPGMKRPEPIPPNIQACQDKVREIGADVGIVNDGDADRIGIVDEHGNFLNQLQVYGLLALYLLEVRGWRGPIVKTLSTTSMLDVLGKIYNVPVYHTGVGFKYVAPKMLEVDAIVGGEESGGYAFKGNIPERDGILAPLFFLDFMVQTGKKPSELLEHLYEVVGARYYYDRIDLRFPPEMRAPTQARIEAAKPTAVAGLKVTGIDTTDGYKYNLEDGGWLLIRFSGTEPVIRFYCETTHEDKVKALLEEGMRIAGMGK